MPFYLLYVLEWMLRLLQYCDRKKAYYNISFEREAYSNGHDLGYLARRKHYSFLNYIRIKR